MEENHPQRISMTEKGFKNFQ